MNYKARIVLYTVLAQVIVVSLYLGATKRRISDFWSLDISNVVLVHSKDAHAIDNNWEGLVGALVIGAMPYINISWVETACRKNNWLPRIYNTTAPYEGENTLTIMRNKGHEAMVYLTYIIDNYETLPPYSMFIHGHQKSWHQEINIDDALRNIRLKGVDEHGYINLRCDWYPSCPAELKLQNHDAIVWGPGVHREDAERSISEAWPDLFPGVPMPETIASQCCAQFVATRQAIQRHPRDAYIRFRNWVLKTELIDDVSGRVFEKLWAYIMTGNAINCPSPQKCACNFFGRCKKRRWPNPPPGLGPLPEDSRWP